MPAANTFVSVQDPDRLLAGLSPYAPFVATRIKLYRYTTEALARADVTGSGGTLVTTFTIIASSVAAADPNIDGPFRYGVYDASQGAGSWYRYLYQSTDGLSSSPLSEPWQSDNRDQITLRDLMYEIGNLMGGSIEKAVCGTNATANLVLATSLWKSTVKDARLYEGQWVYVSQDAAGAAAAPEREEALIDTVDTTTGIATLDRSLTAAVTVGDVILVSAYIPPSELIRAINRAREDMHVLQTLDIALDADEDRYPAPQGVFQTADVLDALGVFQYANSNREDEYPVGFDVEFDGYRGWLILKDSPAVTPFVRVRYKRSYRDIEGELSLMADTTSAPLEWMRVAGALEAYKWLLESDPGFPSFGSLTGMSEDAARRKTARFAPDVVRRIKPRRGVMPGPVEVA